MSLGTGRPIVLRDENTIRHCRVLLSHPMASPTDVRLISLVELIAHKSRYPLLSRLCILYSLRPPAQIYDFLAPLNGAVNNNALALIRRANEALDDWWSGCDELHCPFIYKLTLFRHSLSSIRSNHGPGFLA